MIDISRTLFLVDGQTEIKALRSKFQKEFSKTPALRKVDCNSREVSAEGYANKATPIILMGYHNSFNNFICIVDHERRRVSPITLAKQIHSATKSKVSDVLSICPTIFVCVPNVMFENWIVADVTGIKKKRDLIKRSAQQDCFDGRAGHKVLQQMMIVKYKKVLHGESLFKAVRFNRAKRWSPSFANFCSVLDI